eukprot:11166030-Ditylum_brightwellii.AAC.1
MGEMANATDQMIVIEALEKIDAHIDEAIATTYGNIKSAPNHWWSEEIHHADLLVQYWSARTSMFCNNTFTIDTLTYIYSKLLLDSGIYQGDNNRTPPAQLRKAKKTCWNAQKNSHTKQQTFLEEQIEKTKKTKDMDKVAQEITRMKRGEHHNRLYQNMRVLQGKMISATLPFIDIPNKNAFWAAIFITNLAAIPKNMMLILIPILF